MNLTGLRKSNLMRQEDLAKKLNTSRATVINIELGRGDFEKYKGQYQEIFQISEEELKKIWLETLELSAKTTEAKQERVKTLNLNGA